MKFTEEADPDAAIYAAISKSLPAVKEDLDSFIDYAARTPLDID